MGAKADRVIDHLMVDLLLLRVLLGLEPRGDRLISDPHVPDRVGTINLSGIPGRWGACRRPSQVVARLALSGAGSMTCWKSWCASSTCPH